MRRPRCPTIPRMTLLPLHGAQHLRRAGYRPTVAVKMHFVGPDQLHGLDERLTTDIYPADFGWTPDYRKPGERIDWWYHNLGSVTGAGVAEITNQLEYADVSKEMNSRAIKAAVGNVDPALFPVPDKTITFFGAFTFDPRSKGPVLITPTKILVTPASS